jgi:AP2 domain
MSGFEAEKLAAPLLQRGDQFGSGLPKSRSLERPTLPVSELRIKSPGTSKDSSALSQQGRVHLHSVQPDQPFAVPMSRAEGNAAPLPLFQANQAPAPAGVDASTAQSGADSNTKAVRGASARVAARGLAATGKRGSERNLQDGNRKQARLTGANACLVCTATLPFTVVGLEVHTARPVFNSAQYTPGAGAPGPLYVQARGHPRRPCTGFAARMSGTSAYRGVSWHTQTSRWKAQIKVAGKDVNLGRHRDEVEAARAYDRAAICARGEKDAKLNFGIEDYAHEAASLSAMPLSDLAASLRGVEQRLQARSRTVLVCALLPDLVASQRGVE